MAASIDDPALMTREEDIQRASRSLKAMSSVTIENFMYPG